MMFDRRALLAGMATIGFARPAAAEPDAFERLVAAARARAAAPYSPAPPPPVLRVGQAIFLADTIRATGDPGCFGVAAGVCAVAAERPAFLHLRQEGDAATILALLDGPSLAAAARFRLAADGRDMRIEARLFFRTAVERLALAPCSALVETASPTGAAVREADRLSLAAASGTMSRRLAAPGRPALSRFPAERLKSFGLAFDPGAAPVGERRPSLLVTPAQDWGAGEIHLAEAPAADEFHDNVAVGFVPRRTFAAGDGLAYRYALGWTAAGAPDVSPPTS